MFKKKVIVDLYTSRAEVFEHSKLYRAAQNKPSWWKALPFLEDSESTKTNMKSCSGFNDLYAKSYIIPLWSDLKLEYGEINSPYWRYQYADETSSIVVENEPVREGWVSDLEYQHFKLNMPWIATCSEDVNFMYTNAAYENSKPLDWFAPNGVLNFKHQRILAVNLFTKREESPKELFLPFGTPMAMIVPMTDRSVEFKHHLVSSEEWSRIADAKARRLTFQRNYYKLKKCPFH